MSYRDYPNPARRYLRSSGQSLLAPRRAAPPWTHESHSLSFATDDRYPYENYRRVFGLPPDAPEPERQPTSCRGYGSKFYQRPDERIVEEAYFRLEEHPDIDATDVEVLVQNGCVVLRGLVEDPCERRLVVAMLEDIWGVQELRDELVVRTVAAAAPGAEHAA